VQTCIWPSSKIKIGFTFQVPAHPGSPGQRAVKWMCDGLKGHSKEVTLQVYVRCLESNLECRNSRSWERGVVEKTAFPLCRAMERSWKKNVVSRVSSVIVVIRLPISCVSSMAISCHVPAVSMANG